jgi:murein DD-endopeptidase MepM/ murein hydrolase activator NlpD
MRPKETIRLEKTRFTAMLIEANGFNPDDFQGWAFCPGMRFDSPDKWWGDHGQRDFPHEGIDFCLYEDAAGNLARVDETTLVPAMHNGVVKALFADYLGQAVVVEHDSIRGGGGRFLSVYAHTEPRDGIQPGAVVREGDIIATIADTRRSKAKILPHLHFSLGRPSPGLVYEPFVWNIMRDPGRVTLVDPIDLVDGSWRALGSRHSCCRDI